MILITGGAGFIGSNLVAALEERGETELVVCDLLGTGEKWRNLAKRELADVIRPAELFPYLEAHRGTVRAVFHMGAISATTERDADLIVECNLRLSLDLFHWCARNGARFIYASSAATYGDGTQGFDDDGSLGALARLRPLNAYGWSKHTFDRRVARLVQQDGPRPSQWAGLKFFNVYGPNEGHKADMMSVVAKTFPRAVRGEPAVLFKSHHPDYQDGGQSRDFVWVGDCVAVMLWLYENPWINGLFNCGSGQARSFKDLTRAVYAALGKEAQIQYIDTPIEIRAKYQYFTEAKLERLRAAGYTRPTTSLEEGVRSYVQDYLLQGDPYR
jgi:ADP-L-glycero-D-manno-heptose 6-epimerase